MVHSTQFNILKHNDPITHFLMYDMVKNSTLISFLFLKKLDLSIPKANLFRLE